jgi:hypothetical protein
MKARNGTASLVVRAGADRRIRVPARSRTTRHTKRHRFAHPPHQPGHAPSRFIGAVFRYRRLERSRPGRTSGSFPLLARRRSWGSCPSQVCSRLRVAGPFLSGRAHVPFAPFIRPINFRRADLTAREKENESKIERQIRDDADVGLLGFDSRMRSVTDASFCSRRRLLLPWTLPLAGFRTRFGVHSSGLDPARTISL